MPYHDALPRGRKKLWEAARAFSRVTIAEKRTDEGHNRWLCTCKMAQDEGLEEDQGNEWHLHAVELLLPECALVPDVVMAAP